MKYAELCTTSNFTFLEGASHPEELVTRAAAFGLEAIAITDRNTLAGVVRAYAALKELKREAADAIKIRSQERIDPSSRQDSGVSSPIERPIYTNLPRLIVGARLVLQDSVVEWLALPTDRAAYSRLTRLLTVGKRRAEKGECHLLQADLLEWGKGMILIALPQNDPLKRGAGGTLQQIQAVARRFPGNTFLGAAPRYDGRDKSRINALATLAHRAAVPMVAVGDVLMHHGGRRQLADILTCMRIGITIDQIGSRALPNSERRLKSAPDMMRMFSDHPAAIRRSVEIAGRCTFCLSELSYEYPDEVSGDLPPQTRLVRLTEEGLGYRFPSGVDDKTRAKIDKELTLIDKLGFGPMFVTDIRCKRVNRMRSYSNWRS